MLRAVLLFVAASAFVPAPARRASTARHGLISGIYEAQMEMLQHKENKFRPSTSSEDAENVAVPTRVRELGVPDSARAPLPRTNEAQLIAATEAVRRALDAGVLRPRLRVLLPRGEARTLTPPDETWQGGIMQLFLAAEPLARDLLRALAPPTATGARARVSATRLDASGVDGEGLLVAECESAKDDLYALVQPSAESLRKIEDICAQAGSTRPVLMINPQYRDSDDTLDYIAKNAGPLGSIGTFLGGKAKFVDRLDVLGFADVFAYEQYVVKGNNCQYFLSYPYAWQIYVDGDDGTSVRLGESVERPDYNKIAELLDANGVRPKYTRDLGQGKPLTQDLITTMY